jgi:protein-S-isoprenylcysteine O-methyltransferase Ste14
MRPMFAHAVLLAAILLTTLIRWPHERRRRVNRVARSDQDWRENMLLSLSFIGMVVIPAATVLSRLCNFAHIAFHFGLAWLGVGITAFALWLFWRSHRDLGRHWSPSLVIHDEQAIVDTGVYKYIRHPMYSALFLLCLGQAFLFNDNWLTGLAGLATFGPLYAIRVGREERMMVERFGERYRAYMMRTTRLIPRLL